MGAKIMVLITTAVLFRSGPGAITAELMSSTQKPRDGAEDVMRFS